MFQVNAQGEGQTIYATSFFRKEMVLYFTKQSNSHYNNDDDLADFLKNLQKSPIFLPAIFFLDPPKLIPTKIYWNARTPKNTIHMKHFPLFIQISSLFSTKLLNLKLIFLGIRQS